MPTLLEVPTNLGLRPPCPGSVPGADKAPAALREAGLQRALAAAGWEHGGVVLPGRYAAGLPVAGVRNQAALLDHAHRLAGRLQALAGERVLLLGGDCSTLLGCSLALRRRGRFGLVHVDGHTDFRHPGNSARVSDLAGEDLAAAVGRHLPEVSDIDGLAPYIRPGDAVHLGCRDDDEFLGECRDLLGGLLTASQWRAAPTATRAVLPAATGGEELDGYWVHIDVDVLDPRFMPAVDSPDDGGVTPEHLTTLIAALWEGCTGMSVGILDPDLDPDRRCARLVRDLVLDGVGVAGRPGP